MSIHARDTAKGRRYDVKVRSDDGRQHSKTFVTKRAAVAYEARQMAAMADGVYIAPRTGATTVAELATRWQAAGTKRSSTRARDRSIVNNHLLPGFGADRAVSKVSRADCQALIDGWRAAGLAPWTIARQASAMGAMFQYAVDADLLLRNPALRLKLPATEATYRPQLDSDALEALAEALGDDHAPFMWCGAVLGLRWSETAGLTVASVDMLGGAIRVTAQIDRAGRLAPPKTRGSVRSLSAPQWLLDDLAGLLRRRGLTGANGSSLVFVSTEGGPVAYNNWRRRVWRPATAAAGVPDLRYHDLRSMAASALVASGVDLRTAMHRLGHTTPAMTLAVYARVAQDRDRAAADAVAARVAPRRHGGTAGTPA